MQNSTINLDFLMENKKNKLFTYKIKKISKELIDVVRLLKKIGFDYIFIEEYFEQF